MTSYCPQCLQKFEQKNPEHEFCTPRCETHFHYEQRVWNECPKGSKAHMESSGLPQSFGCETLSDGSDEDRSEPDAYAALLRTRTRYY